MARASLAVLEWRVQGGGGTETMDSGQQSSECVRVGAKDRANDLTLTAVSSLPHRRLSH
jgi:hypothetical protein